MSQLEFFAVSQALESADPLLTMALVVLLLVFLLAGPAGVVQRAGRGAALSHQQTKSQIPQSSGGSEHATT